MGVNLTGLTRVATCDPDTGLKTWSLSTDFTQGSSDGWTAISGNVTYGSNGAEFTINKRYDAPTLETNFYIFFGEVEVVMRAANGTGIVSSIVMESDDLDEIDWVSPVLDDTTERILMKIGMHWNRHYPDPNQLLWQGQHDHLRPRNLGDRQQPSGRIPHVQSRLDRCGHHLVH